MLLISKMRSDRISRGTGPNCSLGPAWATLHGNDHTTRWHSYHFVYSSSRSNDVEPMPKMLINKLKISNKSLYHWISRSLSFWVKSIIIILWITFLLKVLDSVFLSSTSNVSFSFPSLHIQYPFPSCLLFIVLFRAN